jgi:hypothetical protein
MEHNQKLLPFEEQVNMRSSDTAMTVIDYSHGDGEFNRGINYDPRSMLSSNVSELELPIPKEPEEV